MWRRYYRYLYHYLEFQYKCSRSSHPPLLQPPTKRILFHNGPSPKHRHISPIDQYVLCLGFRFGAAHRALQLPTHRCGHNSHFNVEGLSRRWNAKRMFSVPLMFHCQLRGPGIGCLCQGYIVLSELLRVLPSSVSLISRLGASSLDFLHSERRGSWEARYRQYRRFYAR